MTTRLALTLVVALASFPLASCGDDSGSPSGSNSASGSSSGDVGAVDTSSGSAAELCVATINELRKTKGLAPYARWTETESCADGQAQSDATTKSPHGAFGKCQESAQNECPTWAGPAEKMIPQCLRGMWGEGPGGGHYEAMASKKLTKVACGFGAEKSGAIWAVQNFR